MMRMRILCLFTILLAFSCGKDTGEKPNVEKEEMSLEGIYWARLVPINMKLDSKLQGEVKIELFGDEFKARINVKNASKGVHKQFLHSGSECPQIEHDENHDGYIDHDEAMKVLGPVVLPFDDDLGSVSLGENVFPTGNYTYSRSTSFSLMHSDLLHLGRSLVLEKRVVSIYGLAPIGDIPVACGLLTRIAEDPEESAPSYNPAPVGRKPVVRKPPRSYKPEVKPPSPPKPPVEETSWWESLKEKWRRWKERIKRWLRIKPSEGNQESASSSE